MAEKTEIMSDFVCTIECLLNGLFPMEIDKAISYKAVCVSFSYLFVHKWTKSPSIGFSFHSKYLIYSM